MVVKKDGRREPFDRGKIAKGMRMACQKRSISVTSIDEFVDSLELYFQELGRKEVYGSEIGEKVIGKLREWDEVAYVRLASVYRQFKDIGEFMNELQDILRSRNEEVDPDRRRADAIDEGDTK
jgi:transcriptional repressor NrdR